MASVFLARHLLLDRLAAVKILRADLGLDPAHRERFLREARAVTRIQHENIILVTDYGETPEGVAFLVMEYVPGETLGAVMDGQRLGLPRALEIARQIASGLARAHLQNVVHRDLKPENILVSPGRDGEDAIKVVDFGIAKVLDAPALTLNHRIFGTPGYIAPEYASGGGITPRTDLYGLGVVLYEMVTGALPFDADHPADLLVRSLVEAPIPPRDREPDLPTSLNALILRCIARNPDERPRDAWDFLYDLEAVITEVGDARRSMVPESLTPRTVVNIRPPATVRAETTEPPRAWFDTAPTDAPEVCVLGMGLPVSGQSLDVGRAWTAWLTAVRSRVDESLWCEGSSPVTTALDALSLKITAMADEVTRARQHRQRMLALESRGRDFRMAIGRAMDALGADHATRVRERDAYARRQSDLETRVDGSTAGMQHGDAMSRGSADATLWELAACRQLLRESVRACEDLEYQLAALSSQIDKLNEALEADQSALMTALTQTLYDLAQADTELRRLAVALDAAVQGTPSEH